MKHLKDPQNYCYFCMEPLNGKTHCTCDASHEYTVHADTLAHPEILDGRYVKGMPVKETETRTEYIGRDLETGRKVILTAFRTSSLSDADLSGTYDYFPENELYYTVRLTDGDSTLRETIGRNGPLRYADAVSLLAPLNGLAGTERPDLSPDSIYVADREAILPRALPGLLYYGFVPPEYYADNVLDDAGRQYILAALLYYCITGVTPQDAWERRFSDSLPKPSAYGAVLSEAEEETLMRALSVDPAMRCDPAGQETEQKRRTGERFRHRLPKRIRYAIAALAAIVLITAGILFGLASKDNPYREGDSGYSYIHNADVTPQMIRKVTKDKLTNSLTLESCRINDDILKEIASCGHIDMIRLDGCTGFTALDMFAESSVTSLSLSQGEDIQGRMLVQKDLPGITSLEVNASPYNTFSDPDVFLSHFTGVFDLSAHGLYGLKDLSFLYSMPSVTMLDISENERNEYLADASGEPLASCENLSYFTCDRTGFRDLSGLASLPYLSSLSAGENGITDLSALSSAEALEILYVPDNDISNIWPLQNCTAVKYLDLSKNGVLDLSPLSGMHELEALNVSDTQITTLSPLSGIVSLQSLQADNTRLYDLEGLQECTDLSMLTINNTDVWELTPLSSMAKLLYLQASNCNIVSTNGLENCTNLYSLNLSKNWLTDISALNGKQYPEMRMLVLADNYITDISALSQMPKLEYVSLENNKIYDLSPLSAAENLRVLYAHHNGISDISSLPVQKLFFLDLGNNAVSDISVLNGLKQKPVTLLLENNDIADISALPKLSWKFLSLYGNPVSDFSVLENMTEEDGTDSALYFSWISGMNGSPLIHSPFAHALSVIAMDDADKGAFLHDLAEEYGKDAKEPAFMNSEEADAAMEQWRAENEDGFPTDDIPIIVEDIRQEAIHE